MKPHKSQTALQNYLDGLLQDAQAELQQPEPEQVRPVLLEEQPEDRVKVLPTLTTPVVVIPEVTEQPVEEQQEELQEQQEPIPEADAGAPDWMAQPFECLLFNVAGLKMAVPLISLGSIYPLEGDEVTPIFAQPDWFVGIMPTPMGNLKVLDTARWVMPERYHEKMRDNFRFVISIDGYNWGLAVNEVHESVRLQPEEVKWRTRRLEREWLAGTVIEHMCALLDVQALARLVSEKDSPAVRT